MLRAPQPLKIDDDDGIVVIVAATRTRTELPTVREGPLKGKRVEVAPMAGIKALEDLADLRDGNLIEILSRVRERQAQV
jgi:hypothetical protein